MSKFKVITQGLRDTADEEETLQSELDKIYDEVIGNQKSISFKIAATNNIRQRLSNIAKGISTEQGTLRKMHSKLLDAATLYEKTESTICGVAQDGKVTTWDKLSTNRWTTGLGKTTAKTVLDVVTASGSAFGSLALISEILKIAINGGEFSAKDVVSLLKGGKISLENMMKLAEFNKATDDWKNLFGLNQYKNLTLSSGTRWGNASTTFGKTFMDKLGIETTQTGGTKVAGTTLAGWGLTLAANAASNYGEYKNGGITAGRAVAETVMETGIDIAKTAAIGAAVAAGAAALGIGAPAVVVAGVGIVVSAGLDFVCKKITKNVLGEEKGLTETISDAVLDVGEKVVSSVKDVAVEAGKKLSGAVSSAKDAFCSWGKSLGFA